MASHSLKAKFTTFVSAAILLWSLWYLVAKVEWPSVLVVLRRANWLWLVFGGGIAALSYYGVRAWRLFVMVRRVNEHVRYRDIYVLTAFILAFSDMTPGKVGEALKVEMLKRLGILGRLEGAGVFLVERVLDLLVVAALGIVSTALSSAILPGSTHLKAFVAFAFAICTFLLWLFLWPRTLGRFTVPLARLRAAVADWPTLALAGLISACAWVIVAVGWQLSLRSVGIALDLLQSIWLVCVTVLVIIASFVPGGFGISEIVIAEILQHYGVEPAVALAGAVILRCFGLLVIVLGLLHWFFWKRVGQKRYTT